MKKQRKSRASAAAQQKHEQEVASAPTVERKRSVVAPVATSYQSRATVRVGDTLRLEGQERVVVYVNDSRAACIPVGTSRVSWKETADGKVVWDYWSGGISPLNISPRIDPALILRHLSVDEMKSNFSGSAIAPAAANTAETDSERTDSMKKRATQASGGVRAATPEQMGGVAVAEAPAPAASSKSESKKGGKSKSKGESKPAEAVSMAGRSALIKKLATDGKHKDFDAVYEAVNARYPGSSPANVKKVYTKALAASK